MSSKIRGLDLLSTTPSVRRFAGTWCPGIAALLLGHLDSAARPEEPQALDDPFMRGVLVVGLTIFGMGVAEVVNGRGLWHVGGLGFVLLGPVIITSSAFRYESPGLDDPRWSCSRPRRAVRFVLVHTWWVVLVAEIVMAAAGLVYKLT